MLEIDFARDKPAVAGDQFGRGKKRCPAPRLGRHKGRPLRNRTWWRDPVKRRWGRARVSAQRKQVFQLLTEPVGHIRV